MGREISSGKVVLRKLFEDFWFLIPEYQRPYVWTSDSVNELLEDLWFAYKENPENEYFVGSLVLKKIIESSFNEYEVLDGQQRLTTFILLFAVLKDKTENSKLKDSLTRKLFQEENEFDNIPERLRVVYRVRGDSDRFLREFIRDGVRNWSEKDISVKNMLNAIKVIEDFFEHKDNIDDFAKFLLNKVVFIYIATEEREDAFRLFTILNNRGIPLTNADILKAINIGEIEKSGDERYVKEYAEKWQDIQNDLGEDFDRFLGFVRTVLLKEKARKSLLEEFEEKIYKRGILSKGRETIDFLSRYYEIYTRIINFSLDDELLPNNEENNEYKDLITIMKTALPSTDWIPPLLRFYDKFGSEFLLAFLKKLEFKFSSDWILYFTPTQRIENMNRILKKIDEVDSPEKLLSNSEIFKVNIDDLKRVLSGDVYGKRFTKYVLLKYEHLLRDKSQFIAGYSLISVEHILPQNPPKESKWRKWFTDEEIEQYKHKLGNLVPLSRRKNSSLSNLDFEEKKKRYFKKDYISIFPSVNWVMSNKSEWKKEDIEKRTEEMVSKLISCC